MGQSVQAIVYGVKMGPRYAARVSELLQDEDGDWVGFERGDKPNATDSMHDRYDVLGYVVAIEAHNRCHPGAVEVDRIPAIEIGDPGALVDIEELIGEAAMAEAQRKWGVLRKVAGRRLRLPRPTFIITTVSTA